MKSAPPDPPASSAPPPSGWLDPASPRVLKHAGALLVVAVTTAGFGIAFRAAASFFFRIVFGAHDIVSAFERLGPLERVGTLTLGGVAAGLIGALAARYKGGQGVGGVMEVIALGTGRISLRASLWKALGCWVAIATGSSVGREGPIIQFGGAMGGAVGSLGRMAPDRVRLLIAAGTASGFAAAYNTPFAAVLFVLEVVVGVITVDAVLATVLGAAIATAVTRLALGGGPIYGARTFALASDWELGLYLVVGALAGGVGAGFNELLARLEALFSRLPWRRPLIVAVGAALVGVMAVAWPGVTGNGYETINRMLDGSVGARAMLILLVAKALATGLSVGSGTPGGAFTPSLFLGAALGGSIGDALGRLAPHHPNAPGAYALVGMAALCAGTTHAPLMAAVLVFELSSDYSIVLPLLLATGMATLVSRRLRPRSVYMDELERRGIGWEMTWEGREVREKAE